MAETRVAPYGSWRSPITAGLIAARAIGLGQIALDGDNVYWLEMRPAEGGRNVLVRRAPSGQIEDVMPAGFNVRTRVHEYGGGAFLVSRGTVYFSNFADQRVWRQSPGQEPQPLAPEAPVRYADYVLDTGRNRLICVREDHGAGEQDVRNTLVALDLAGGDTGQVLAAGHDFYSTPRLSPDGSRLAWLQ
jgi:hypothetical protein